MRSMIRLLATARELWPWYLGIVVAALGVAGLSLVTPFLIKSATDEVVAQTQGAGSGVPVLLWLAVALLIVEVANTLLSNVGGYLGDTMTMRLRAILSGRYYAKLLSLPQRYFDTQLTGTLINRLNRSISETAQFLQMFSNNFFPMLLTVLAVLVIAATYSWPLAVLLVVIYPLFMWLTTLTSKHWQELEKSKNTDLDIAGGRFAEVIGQIRVVKSFVRERDELQAFGERYGSAVATTSVQSRYWHLMDVARRGALNVIFFGIYAIIFLDAASGTFSLGVMVLLIQLVAMARQPVMMMSYLVDTAQRAIAGTRDYFTVLDELPEPHAVATGPAADAAAWPTLPEASTLAFEAVTFGYDTDTDVVADITFAVAQGERVAFVGESGGGKTTLINLLLGLYRPGSGRILLEGTDIATQPVASLRRQIGVVFQDAALFSGTIRENITYGRPGASDDEMIEAARRANVHEFVAKLPQGYDTEIGERGLKLSGGQKQRIAVARAMLKDAPVLVLDEATSALDSKAERLVQAGLEELMADRTSLIIAHRLSTISGVDRIVTLRDGRVDEIGSPAELAVSGGIYAELLALQASASKADRKRLQAYDITA